MRRGNLEQQTSLSFFSTKRLKKKLGHFFKGDFFEDFVVFRDTALEWFCYGAGERQEKIQRRSRCKNFQFDGEAVVYGIRRPKKYGR